MGASRRRRRRADSQRAVSMPKRRTRRNGPAPTSEVMDMDQRSHRAAWDVLRMRHGITLRLIEQIPAEQLTRHPIAGMRTPVELLVHMYATLEAFPEGALTGKVEAVDEAPLAAVITTRAA